MGVPRYLLMVAQFLYRYLFVISEEAQHMRAALQAKSGSLRNNLLNREIFGAPAGVLSVLFARSYAHAEGVHQAMQARGFRGHFRTLSSRSFARADALFVAGALILVVGTCGWWRRGSNAAAGRRARPSLSIRRRHRSAGGVDFHLFPGETVAVFGANGSGKTTFVCT